MNGGYGAVSREKESNAVGCLDRERDTAARSDEDVSLARVEDLVSRRRLLHDEHVRCVHLSRAHDR
jgi:hypothetical protein